MESVIAGLLKQFEDGKLTRRQLIQSLTLAAAAAVPTGQALAQEKQSQIPPPRDPAPWKTVYLDHISYAVSDYRRSTAFYRDLMGWTIANESANGNQCTLNIGSIGQIIIRNNRQGRSAETSAATGGAAAQGNGQANRPPLTGVINHISFGIDPWDTDKVKAELDRRGLNPRPDMVGDNFKSFHVFDPDGWDLQISNKTKQG